jgi:hypothetical protein
MKPRKLLVPKNAKEEMYALMETMRKTGERLEVLTGWPNGYSGGP